MVSENGVLASILWSVTLLPNSSSLASFVCVDVLFFFMLYEVQVVISLSRPQQCLGLWQFVCSLLGTASDANNIRIFDSKHVVNTCRCR